MAFAGASSWALGPQGSGLASRAPERRRAEDLPCGRPSGQLHNRVDQLAPQYVSLADDSSTEAKRREAALLFCAAEGHLNDEEVEEALRSAMAALPLFREVGDANAVHDTLRVIINAQRMEASLEYKDKPEEAERFARQELAHFEEVDDVRGQAAMLLALTECLCDHRRLKMSELDEAEGWGQRALSLFGKVKDDKMTAITLLELAHIHALRTEADGVLEKANRARELFRRVGDQAGDARALHGVAIASVLDRRLDDAVAGMREALATFRALGIRKQEAFELCVMAEVYLEDEKPLKALPNAREALSIFRDIEYGRGWEAAALYAVVRAMIGKQQPDLAVKAAKEGVARLLDRSDRRQQVYGFEILSEAHLAEGKPQEALEACQSAQEILKELEDKRMDISVHYSIMWVHIYSEEWAAALEQMDDALAIAQELDDEREEAAVVHNIAFVHLQRGDYQMALSKAEEARKLFQKAESKRGEASALLVAAACFDAQERLEEAAARCKEAQALYQAARDLQGEGDTWTALAELYLRQQDRDAAIQAAERGVQVMRQYANKRAEAAALRLLTRAQLEAQQLERAEKSALQAKEAASAVQDRVEITEAQLLLTQVYFALGEGKEAPERGPHPLERAMKSATEAVALSGRCNDRGLVAISRFMRARLLHGTGRLAEALLTAEEALRWFRKAEDAFGEARTLILQGDVALGLNQKEEARAFAREALDLAGDLGSAQTESEASELLQRIEAKERVPLPVAMPEQLLAQVPGDTPAAIAAAPAAAVSVAKPEPKGLDPVMVKRKVLELTRNLMASDEDLENDSPFMEAGMDSLSSVQLMSELSREFQMAMSPSLVFDFPTVNALADHLVEESRAGTY